MAKKNRPTVQPVVAPIAADHNTMENDTMAIQTIDEIVNASVDSADSADFSESERAAYENGIVETPVVEETPVQSVNGISDNGDNVNAADTHTLYKRIIQEVADRMESARQARRVTVMPDPAADNEIVDAPESDQNVHPQVLEVERLTREVVAAQANVDSLLTRVNEAQAIAESATEKLGAAEKVAEFIGEEKMEELSKIAFNAVHDFGLVKDEHSAAKVSLAELERLLCEARDSAPIYINPRMQEQIDIFRLLSQLDDQGLAHALQNDMLFVRTSDSAQTDTGAVRKVKKTASSNGVVALNHEGSKASNVTGERQSEAEKALIREVQGYVKAIPAGLPVRHTDIARTYGIQEKMFAAGLPCKDLKAASGFVFHVASGKRTVKE